ncbi:MAG TPA: type II toxin-antitoxin system VapC family toxin [Candidatus Bathyarchaeia archaeon]
MVCLDTTFFADLFRKNPAAEKKLIELANETESVSTTVMTIAELYYGAFKSKNMIDEMKNVASVLSNFQILEMNSEGAKKFGEILSTMEEKGQKIPDRDILIGAISLSKGEQTIITRNAKDFCRIPGIKVITY